MIDARAIGHATFETPDIERAIEYYTQILGLHVADRGPKRAVLVTHIGREAVVLEAAGAARCASISLQVAPGTELGDVAKVLSASEGISSERRSGVTPGIAEVLSFTDPNGVKVELYTEGKPSRARDTAAIGPLKLGHIAFCTGDVKKLTEFYCRVLGFRVSDWMEDFFCFLRCGPDHHTVNFATAKAPKLHHVAFELKDWAHMQNACEVLGRKNLQILWGPGRHGIGHNIFIYHRNADDQIVECFTELDMMLDEKLGYFEPRPWHKDNPQLPKVWKRADAALTWGTQPMPDYFRGKE